MSSGDPSLVRIESGAVRGRVGDGVVEFRGIPYARPPVGARRFRLPEPVVPWDGELDATAARGPSAPQGHPEFRALDIAPVVGDGWTEGDDYLTANVWTPVERGEGPRPVMVWIHGGAYMLGSKDAAVYDGASFARSGAVTVAFNYRLGVEGFLPVDGAPTNLGLRDMIAALSWVRRNIAEFGGDPGNVTIFGESAGGMAVDALVASPLTEGLFRRAIAQSGSGTAVFPIEVARRTAARIAKILKVAPDADGFRSVPAGDAVKAMTRAARPGTVDLRDADGRDPFLGFNLIAPVYGDDVLPLPPLTLLQRGAGKDVELLVGTTAEEANFWIVATPLRLLPKPVVKWALRRVHPDGNALYGAYARPHPGRRAGEVWAAALTDVAFRWPTRQVAEAHQGRTHVYEFEWRSPALNGRLGATHGLDIAFTFDTLATVTGPRGMAGQAPPQAVATHMHGLWARFAEDGSLPWPEFEPTGRAVYQIAARRAVHEPVLPAADFMPSLKDLA
jgi:para-nitrobenzyl esterase